MRVIYALEFFYLFFFLTHASFGLPYNFGRPQEPLKYKELTTKNYVLYYDERTPNEARGLLHSLEAAKPHLEKWLDIRRKNYLPVIASATTSNASFANFLTDAVELQTLGMGGRDLAWHELVHSTMYLHLKNILGPAGSIIHLPWMPAWWIEGFAEALSVSIGSAEQANIERWYATTNTWPSYDRLHSLYGQGSFAREGYGVSGAFVAYILRTYHPTKIPKFLQDFKANSQPWMWPLTVVPFLDYMPMDNALRSWTGKNGSELYTEYKQKAKEHWKKLSTRKDYDFYLKMRQSQSFSQVASLDQRGSRMHKIINENGLLKDIELRHTPTGLANGTTTVLGKHDIYRTRYVSKNLSIFLTSQINDNRERIYTVHASKKPNLLGKALFRTKAVISHFFVNGKKLFWLERDFENQRLCFTSLFKIKKIKSCPIELAQPFSLEYLGQIDEPSRTRQIWLRKSVETLAGDRHKIIVFDTERMKIYHQPLNEGGKPLSFTKLGGYSHLLLSSQNSYHIRTVSREGNCLTDFKVPVASERIFNINEHLYLGARVPNSYKVISVDNRLTQGNCMHLGSHQSPLSIAQRKKNISLKDALKLSSTWKKDDQKANEETDAIINEFQPTKSAMPRLQNLEEKNARWRGRPLFIFPWIDSDSGGNTFGFRSVPLMDEMQNETVHFSTLYGPYSKFPNISLTLESNRFKTYYTVNLFNQQTYNGSFNGDVLYYKETGGSVKFNRYFPTLDFNLSYGSKLANFTPLIGPDAFVVRGRRGKEASFNLQVSKVLRFSAFSWSHSFDGFVVPEQMNRTWSYNKIKVNTTVSIPFSLFGWRSTTYSLGLSGSRTRGKKKKYLQELYRPLKTFVPGSGGGLNGANFPILGEGHLTSSQTGDTQANVKMTWTFPIIPELDTLIGIFYMERLDFTAFFTYGGAWQEGEGMKPEELVQAHGYNLDLSTDIKGITVNVGLGTGQVVGESFEFYFKFGFDTLIDIE